ncbi:family 1 encapsulin nanocompartment shell protein [Skermania piniformis]|uniref:Type 1 encapsulin shell protein n=1 Tax=Skermania pinensis TaxID=39122 RepID=A0ABX8SDS7_9ACTN|nr:family 1 encapsulin nanocompartment shell protein [Skermania piniformis]QXQ13816.1 bacteriocin family protein [Skermania piniformis]
MNNLHRELAPITAPAWAAIEEEATRTFRRNIAGRRVVDVSGPHGTEYSAVGLGRTEEITSPARGVQSRLRRVAPLVELRVPFSLSRRELDDVQRGAKDPDLDPLKEAAQNIAFAEDQAIFEGFQAAGIRGMRATSTNDEVSMPTDIAQVPDAIARALSTLRLAGVGGHYALLLGADYYTLITESSVYGYPLRDRIARQLDGDIVWAPAIRGAFLVSTRGGDFDLQLGQDLSIGYLSHDADTVQLYFQESLTFLVYTPEASVALSAV